MSTSSSEINTTGCLFAMAMILGDREKSEPTVNIKIGPLNVNAAAEAIKRANAYTGRQVSVRLA